MEECIRLVRDEKGDPNAQSYFYSQEQNESLTLLEEAILSQYPEALRIFIAHGADVHKVSKTMKKKFGNEITLLHLALMTPDEMKALNGIRSVDRSDRQAKLAHSPDSIREKISKNLLAQSPLFIPLPPEEEMVPSPYVPKKALELLLKKRFKFKTKCTG
jgi:hypothetical protein